MNRSVAVITIGQTPRTDVMPEFERFLGPDVRVVEAGALDDLTEAEVEAMAPETTGSILVTRLRDGSEVKLGEDFVFPRTQECIRRVEHQVDLILLLCTGSFPRLNSMSCGVGVVFDNNGCASINSCHWGSKCQTATCAATCVPDGSCSFL